MSVSAAHASAFYAEAAEHQRVWGIRDGGGFPAPLNGDGERAMPFWSLRSRAERVVSTVPAYAAFEVVEVPLDAFLTRWLPGLERDGLRVGLNWSGSRATGYDMAPPAVLAQLQTACRCPRAATRLAPTAANPVHASGGSGRVVIPSMQGRMPPS